MHGVAITGTSSILAHTPGLVPLGSKPEREIASDPGTAERIRSHLRDHGAAVSYAPNQVMIGNEAPEALWDLPRPWHSQPSYQAASRWSDVGEVMPETEFLGLVALSDSFGLVTLDEAFAAEAADALAAHPLLSGWSELARLKATHDSGPNLVGRAALEEVAGNPGSVALRRADGQLVGAVRRDHDTDEAVQGPVLLENLAVKASAFLALVHLNGGIGTAAAQSVDYLLGCGEEAIGDRYQRGGGSLAKASAELAGCENATASDTKAFCCAPVHSIVEAAALVASGVFDEVVVVGGGSLAKLGMKFAGHVESDMPILEDVLAAMAIRIGRDDGRSPLVRLDSVGKHAVRAGGTPPAIMKALVTEPLDRLGLAIPDVDRFATELHNPEVTEPSGSGNVPKNNYRMIGSLAKMQGSWSGDLDEFERRHGMPGFSPTQGHIASAIPFITHAHSALLSGSHERVQLMAKGSLFLGRMTRMADGMSVLLERNG